MSFLNKIFRCIFFNSKTSLLNTIHHREVSIKIREPKTKDFYTNKSDPKTYRLYVWGLAELGALGERKLRSKQYTRTYVYRPARKTLAFIQKVTDFSCGYGFTLYAVKTNSAKKVFVSGLNTDGQIGYHSVRRNAPLKILFSTTPVPVPLKSPYSTNIVKVAAGRAHSLILTDKEGIFSMGNNAFGQCGRIIVEDEDYTAYREMHKIEGLNNEDVSYVECGQDHSLFLTKSGQLYSCGCGSDGQTGLGYLKSTTKPTLVEGDIKGENIIKVKSTGDTVLALNDKGEAFGWGNNEYSQLPIPNEIQQISAPMHLKHLNKLGKIKDIAAGSTFCMILTEDRNVYVWGYGILGKGPNLLQTVVPKQIPSTLFGCNQFYPDVTVESIYCGVNTLAAINNKGDLYMWGKNNLGQLGLGHINHQYFPFRVSIGAKVMIVGLGADHTLAYCKPYV